MKESSMCLSTLFRGEDSGVKTKSFEAYAKRRRDRMTSEERAVLDSLNAAYGMAYAVHSARMKRGMTQAELSRRSGVTQADISRIERALIVPKLPTIARLLEALDARLVIELDGDTEAGRSKQKHRKR
jgi:ribosome-binding protein aMBF1 (putative translation factor)